ncbi:hypothetical protein [Flavisphingomonas formosensis]|uniref:hypothetical protein n=1 Tax=Flavisphingomonas formosensis TaxID=861534 RepID=UPI0012F97815|nr:hypothetical protein [Sphingomonas formosensis]
MPRVPHPDPLYPVVWAETPTAPDSPATPAVSGLPEDDDPIQLHLDEALVRKADNDTVDRWKTLSGPWFAARGEDAATRWKDIEQSLHEIVRRPLGELATTRQRNMYRDIMEPRLSAWGDEARAHADRETQAFNDSESRQRQDLALAAMRRGARLNDMRAVAEGERRIIGEVRGRSRRQGLDPDATSAAETDALGAAHADLVEHLAQHDPQHAQGWLDAHGGMISDPAKVERLKNMLQPYVAEQQQEGLADLIREEGGDLPAQHAAVDAMGLDAPIADGLKQRLADMAEGDRRTAEKEQDAALSRVMAAVLDPEMQTLRGIPPADYYALTPDRLKMVNAVMAANLRGEGAVANPGLYRALANRAARGVLTNDEVRKTFERLPHSQVDLFGPVSEGEMSKPSGYRPFSSPERGELDNISSSNFINNDLESAVYDPDIVKPKLDRAGIADWTRRKWNGNWRGFAEWSVGKAIKDPKTSQSARDVLGSFLSGKGRKVFYYGPQSQGLKELFTGETGGYFEREQIEAMRYMAYKKGKRGYLKDGDKVDNFVFRDFTPVDGALGFKDGTQMGDIVGTITHGLEAYVKDDRFILGLTMT